MSGFLQDEETDFLPKNLGSGLSSIFRQSSTSETNEDLQCTRVSRQDADAQHRKTKVKNASEGRLNQPRVYMVDIYCYKAGSDSPINMGKGGLATVKAKNGVETLILYKTKRQPLVAMPIGASSTFDIQNDTFGFFRFNSTAWSLGFASHQLLSEFSIGFAKSKVGKGGDIVQEIRTGNGDVVTENKMVSLEMRQGDQLFVNEFLVKSGDWTGQLVGKKVMGELFLYLDGQWIAENLDRESGFVTAKATILEINDPPVEVPVETIPEEPTNSVKDIPEKLTGRVKFPQDDKVQVVHGGMSCGPLNATVIDMLLTEQRLLNLALMRMEQKLDQASFNPNSRELDELKADKKELSDELEVARKNFKVIEKTLGSTQKELSSVREEIQMIILAREKEDMLEASTQTGTDDNDELTKRILKNLFKRIKASLKSSGSASHSTEEVLECITEQIRQII